jgi:hypothetical protein
MITEEMLLEKRHTLELDYSAVGGAIQLIDSLLATLAEGAAPAAPSLDPTQAEMSEDMGLKEDK